MEGSNEENQKLSAEQRQEYEDQLTGLKKEIDLLGTHLDKLQVRIFLFEIRAMHFKCTLAKLKISINSIIIVKS